MSKQRRRMIAVASALLGLALLITAFGVANAQDKPGFVTTFRRWVRTTSGYVGDNKAFADAKVNPAKLDLSGFHTIYANDKALANFLTGKKAPFAEGSVIVAEFFSPVNVKGTTVFLEDPSKPKFTAWMIKDSTQGADQGGWRWEGWAIKDGKDVNLGLDAKTQVAACVACHKAALGGAAAKTDLVFDNFSDQAHIKDYQAQLDKMMGVAPATMAATMGS